jgi:hypothetical protein
MYVTCGLRERDFLLITFKKVRMDPVLWISIEALPIVGKAGGWFVFRGALVQAGEETCAKVEGAEWSACGGGAPAFFVTWMFSSQ